MAIDYEKALAKAEQAAALRTRKLVTSAQSRQIEIDGEYYLNFSGNDYLGLANSEPAKQALASGAEAFGFGSSASHLVSGHQLPHQQLEEALADFLKRDAAVCFASGYMANLAILQTLAHKGDTILADKLNHVSLIDGGLLSRADSLRYPHCDLLALENRLKKASANPFVVTDSVFSMDGDIAPLHEIAGLCQKYAATLIVDDAHGLGVLGDSGGGCAEYFNLNQEQLPVLMTTFGKALGGYGAAVSGKRSLVDYLIQNARSYIYTTAMPAAIACANLANLRLLASKPELVAGLQHNIDYFREQAGRLGLALLASQTAVQPIVVGSNERLVKLNQRLFEQGLLVGAIRPPTVPENTARLRITLSASHRQEDIDRLIQQLALAIESA